jgi:hypothetical protein
VRLVDEIPPQSRKRRKTLRGTATGIVGIAIAILAALQVGVHP